jgi:hypothetical protein
MMRKLWLAVVLGLILGVAANAFPSQTVLQQPQALNMPLGPITASGPPSESSRLRTIQPPPSQLLTLLLGLAVGLVAALPAFLVMKRRS